VNTTRLPAPSAAAEFPAGVILADAGSAANAAPVRPVRRQASAVRRLLLVSDVLGLTLAFVIVAVGFPSDLSSDPVALQREIVVFVCAFPFWFASAVIVGLYDFEENRTGHTTVDELFGIVSVVTIGTWMVLVVAWVTGVAHPQLQRLVTFWILSSLLVIAGRATCRHVIRSRGAYMQRALIVGAGDVGQLVARKIQQHPEYRISLVGFLDDEPKQARRDLAALNVLGSVGDLARVVSEQGIDRVIVAFSNNPDTETMVTTRALLENDVMVDVVPRLFEITGPRASVHSIEGLSLICLPPARRSRIALACKRALDVVGSLILLVILAPLCAYAAIRIKLDSAGPVFFRQTRLGRNMEPFTLLKFRTMAVDTDEDAHRDFVRGVASSDAELGSDGLYKLARPDAVTRFGSGLRRTSLDEVPQLLNVLRGEMSLVGPRPCIPYETENFAPHHFERFLVPQGLTGLWQVTARANSTFGEALDMDVAYARGWALGLDLRLLLRTPFALIRHRKATL